MNNNYKKFKLLINILRAITIWYFIWIILGGNLGQLYMVWNVFLAWIPLEISLLINKINSNYKKTRKTKIAIIFLGILWLLFYPNSPYIVTDFIHLAPNQYHIINPDYTRYSGETKVLFNNDIGIWIDFASIGIGVWIGYVTGFISLYINQDLLQKRYNHIIEWIFILILHILTGFAIYIGRFNRWNSWDIIFNPINIIKILQENINFLALKFTALFGVFSFTLYIINYLLIEIGKER